MKVAVLALASVLAGLAAAVGSVWWDFSAVPQFLPTNQTLVPPQGDVRADDDRPGPRAEVLGGLVYEFGVGQRNHKMSHIFEIRNAGSGPLTLETGDTTCKCTLSDLDRGELAPGEVAQVNMEWKLTTPGEDFRQTAEILTNDPQQETLYLGIHGKVVDLVSLQPGDLVLSSVSASDGAKAEFRLLGRRDENLQIEQWEFTEPKNAEFFDLSFTPLPESELESDDVRSGLLASVAVKPGLPLGPFAQTIRLTTNVDDAGQLELPISGSVVSDISVVGPKFLAQRNLLSLSQVDGAQGSSVELKILVKGPLRAHVRFTVKSIDPADSLQAELGEATTINNGVVTMFPLMIRVPPGARPVSRMGSEQGKYGEILLETTHPDAKSLPIYVRFAVR